jgi:Rrf2 family protein
MTGEFAIAVHALIYLDKCAKPRGSEALAQNVCTNPARVRKVMAQLRRAGLVQSRAGAEGGYRFDLRPQDVTLLQIAEALNAAPISGGWRSGDPAMPCMIASGMARAMDRVYEELNRVCLDRLAHITLTDVAAQLVPGARCPNPLEAGRPAITYPAAIK